MSVTLWDLRTIFYDILREDQTSGAYPLTFTDHLLNTAYQNICLWLVSNPLFRDPADKYVRKGKLPFVNVDLFLENIQSTSLSQNVSIGATTLPVGNATDFPTSGVLFIAWNIITYTGTTSTSFTWCNGVSFAFNAGQEVSIAYDLPANFSSVLSLVYNNNYEMQMQNYDDIFENLNQNKRRTWLYNDYNQIGRYNSWEYRRRPFYTIKDANYLVIFNANRTWDIIRLRYEKTPPMLVNITDTVIIDNDLFAKTTIPYIAVWEMLYNRGEEQRGGEILSFWLLKLREMYTFYNDNWYRDPSGMQYRSAKWRLNI